MDLKRFEIKALIEKVSDRNLSFRAFELTSYFLENYMSAHKNDHFCIYVIEKGTLTLHIEDQVHLLKKGKLSVIFPDQIHFISDVSNDLQGKVVLFEEILFCSDILKNELSSYNVNLVSLLNCVLLSLNDFERSLTLITNIKTIYENPSLITKEQARFYIKIMLLGFIESVHGQQPLLHQENDKHVYLSFKELINAQYKSQRTVQYYADQLSISPKKLNTITKKHCGETAINAIHKRILTEIKRQMLFSDYSHKEIAFDLGFSSPSALNKFVKAKLHETPSELQSELAQIYNR